MYRKTSRPRSFRRSSFKRRPRLKDPQRTRGLEAAHFFIDETTVVANSSAAEALTYTHLVSIPLSIDADTTNSSEQRVGTVLSSMQRFITLHGIVMDYGIVQQAYAGDNSDPQDGHVWSIFQLLTDRLNSNSTDAPFPASISSYSPFQNQFPTAILSPTTPLRQARENADPTRIHFTQTRLHHLIPLQVGLPLEGALYVPTGQPVSFRSSTVNRRLRIRLDDQHGFFIGWAFRTSASMDVPDSQTRTFRRWARGTLYYRFNQ